MRYVIYSHSHFDHAEGGGAFAATATFVGHENMARNLDGRYPHMPGDMVDRNNNGVIDRDEIDIPTTTRPGVCGMFVGFFDTIDRNHDGIATPQELLAYVVKPTVLYSDRMRIELGGKVVELVHPGLEPLGRRDGTSLSQRTRGVRNGVRRGRARERQRPLAAERVRAVRRQSARGVDQVVQGGRGAGLRRAADGARRAAARQIRGARNARILRVPARSGVGGHGGGQVARGPETVGAARAATRTGRTTSACARTTSKPRT